MSIRVGHGFDVHAFGDGDYLMLGGVRIPYKRGLIAHSDGDVLLHALCDALLGAAAMGDIGKHFPDTDANYENADSRQLLRETRALIQTAGWRVENVDLTVVAQAPKLAGHIDEMRVHIASDLGTDYRNVNVKATTTEKLGYIGREEGIACHAVALITSLEPYH